MQQKCKFFAPITQADHETCGLGGTCEYVPAPLVVTRHQGLVEYLIELGLVSRRVEVLAHATAEQVRGKHVFGVLPLHLAVEAAMITEIPLSLTPEMRGRELSLADMREVAGKPVTYTVMRHDEGAPSL